MIAGFQEDSEPSKVVEIIPCAPESSENKEDIIVNYDQVLPKEQEVEWKSTEIQWQPQHYIQAPRPFRHQIIRF